MDMTSAIAGDSYEKKLDFLFGFSRLMEDPTDIDIPFNLNVAILHLVRRSK
jgi:hypothetical protein